MPDLQLYTLVVPSAAQGSLDNRQQQQLARAGILGSDVGAVDQIATGSADETITGVYRGKYAEKMAAELKELAAASGVETVAVVGIGTETPLDGYYAVDNARTEPAQPQTGKAQRYELALVQRGRRGSHFRALETNPRQVDHDFGSDLDSYVGAPATASKVRWYDPDTSAIEQASVLETRAAEGGDVDIYDVDASSYDTPALIYEIGYAAEENVDVRVYDTLGNTDKLDTDGNLQWRKVFATDHDTASSAELIVDNGLLRLRLDEAAGTIAAQEWDETNTTWTDVGLSAPSGVSLFDVDIMEIGMATVRAQLLIDDNGTLFALDVTLARGDQNALFALPENESGPIPTNIQDWLEPIAKTTLVDPQAAKDLVARADVRK